MSSADQAIAGLETALDDLCNVVARETPDEKMQKILMLVADIHEVACHLERYSVERVQFNDAIGDDQEG